LFGRVERPMGCSPASSQPTTVRVGAGRHNSREDKNDVPSKDSRRRRVARRHESSGTRSRSLHSELAGTEWFLHAMRAHERRNEAALRLGDHRRRERQQHQQREPLLSEPLDPRPRQVVHRRYRLRRPPGLLPFHDDEQQSPWLASGLRHRGRGDELVGRLEVDRRPQPASELWGGARGGSASVARPRRPDSTRTSRSSPPRVSRSSSWTTISASAASATATWSPESSRSSAARFRASSSATTRCGAGRPPGCRSGSRRLAAGPDASGSVGGSVAMTD